MSYTVEVTREMDAWIADVVGLPGAHTFARNLTALAKAVQEVIALVADLPVDAEPQSIRYVYRNVGEDFLEATKIGEQRDMVEAKQRELAAPEDYVTAWLRDTTVDAAHKLASLGYSVRDISGALRMSPGRVSQIMKARE